MRSPKGEATYRRCGAALAANLVRLRTDRRLSQEGMAARAGIHWRHAQKIEAGAANVTLRTLARVADGLEVPLPELLQLGAPRKGGR